METNTSAFGDPGIARLDLIVPIYTMSEIAKQEALNLSAAVQGGVGLGGYHGGMGDAFRNSVDYQFMVGGQWVAHPGDIIDYRVDIVRPDDPVMAGITSFPYRSECMSTRRTRCSQRPPFRQSTPNGSMAWSCQ